MSRIVEKEGIIEVKSSMPRKILAIDYGEKFIGLAQFHESHDPFPIMLERMQNKGKNSSLNKISKLCEDDFFTDIVFGIPYLLDGQSTSTTEKMIKVYHELSKELEKNNLNVTLHQQDETLTTFQAQEEMKNSALYNFKVDLRKIDSLSARIILEDFLGQKR